MAGSMRSVLARFLPGLRQHQSLSPRQAQVCAHLQDCRTGALGGVQLRCDHCAHAPVIALSCRDRHCPRCQRQASRAWAERQLQAVLPVTYYHLVFTLPHSLDPWVELHPEVIYRLLFRSVWDTLKGFGEDPKRLGGQLGMSAVLHTWGEAWCGTCTCTA